MTSRHDVLSTNDAITPRATTTTNYCRLLFFSVIVRFKMQCGICDKSVGSKKWHLARHQLRLHEVIPTGYKTFDCTEAGCEVVTMDAQDLTDHKKKVHNIAITCDKGCGASFGQVRKAKRHAKMCQGEGLRPKKTADK